MSGESLILLSIFVPICGSLLLPLVARVSVLLRNALSFLCVFLPFALSIVIYAHIRSGGELSVNYPSPLGFNLSLSADFLAVYMACVSSFISLVIVIYSFGYISRYDNQAEYYSMVVLFVGAMMGLVYSSNLIFMYIFWEITALTSWRLIGFFREKEYVLRADKAFLMTVFGAVIMLLGFVNIFAETGSFDLLTIEGVLKGASISKLSVLLILFGIFSKSATLPFQVWLPDAGVAPSPVTALLHAAVLVKIGVYVFVRLFVFTFNIEEVWHTAVPLIAGVSAIISGGAAFVETDLKRIIAYSTISQIGFIFLGLSIGNEIGIVGGLLYIFIHGLAKAGLFLCAGIVEQNTHTRDIRKMGGLAKTMPLTALAFLFCSLSIMGTPPFGGFFAKYLVMSAAVNSGNAAITLIFLIAAFFTVLYLFRVFYIVFMGEPPAALPREGSFSMVGSVLLLAVLSLVAGIYIYLPYQAIGQGVRQMLGL